MGRASSTRTARPAAAGGWRCRTPVRSAVRGTAGDDRRPRLLELFKGTGSVGRVFAANGFEVVSLDMVPGYDADIQEDLLRWDYKQAFPPGHFDVVWASPPCTEYSIAKTRGERDLALADRIVRHTRRIIRYLRPARWFLENPQSGYLKDRPVVRGVPYVDVDYCRFSDWGYRKRTRVWYGGEPAPQPALCLGAGRCPNMRGSRHRVSLDAQGGCESVPRALKYRVPGRLIAHLAGLSKVPRDLGRRIKGRW